MTQKITEKRIIKAKCKCGWEGLIAWEEFNETAYNPCPAYSRGEEDQHTLSRVYNINPEDWMEQWENDLENENYHNLTRMPSILLSILEKYIKDKKVLSLIMKNCYEKIGTM